MVQLFITTLLLPFEHDVWVVFNLAIEFIINISSICSCEFSKAISYTLFFIKKQNIYFTFSYKIRVSQQMLL